LDVEGDEPGKATAFCVGETNDGQGVYLTAKHNLRGATRIRIKVRGEWHTGFQINQHPSADVASFEAPVLVEPMIVGAAEQPGQPVTIPGFGPEYFGRTPSSFTGVLETGYVSGERGLHPIPGDSGAPVVIGENVVVGVVKGYDTPYQQTTYRSDYAEQRLKTRYTGVIKIRECLQQCYQSCPPTGCRIWIRNEYRQPIGFLGMPAGPPQRVQVAEPVPRVFVPEDQQPQRPVPDRISVQGPPGPAGPQGPAFLVFRNFDAIYSYNAAESYALAIAHLSDRLKGGSPFKTAWPTDDAGTSRAERREIQQALLNRGYDIGEVDGLIGAKSREAISEFQKSSGLVVNGRAGQQVLKALRAPVSPRAPAQGKSAVGG
jgi:hypothetical protein